MVKLYRTQQARSQDFLRGGGGGCDQKKVDLSCLRGVRGGTPDPIFNKKVDLSCLRGGGGVRGVRAHPSHPPVYGPAQKMAANQVIFTKFI